MGWYEDSCFQTSDTDSMNLPSRFPQFPQSSQTQTARTSTWRSSSTLSTSRTSFCVVLLPRATDLEENTDLYRLFIDVIIIRANLRGQSLALFVIQTPFALQAIAMGFALSSDIGGRRTQVMLHARSLAAPFIYRVSSIVDCSLITCLDLFTIISFSLPSSLFFSLLRQTMPLRLLKLPTKANVSESNQDPYACAEPLPYCV